jgi:hypothetical protein
MRDIDEEILDIGLRRHSDDKLTYKLIIANAINECRRVEGEPNYYDSVKALINLLSFNIRGYKLKEQIDEVKKKLDEGKKQRYKDEEENTPRWKYYKKANLGKLKGEITKWYWETFFRQILQILATEGLLFDTERIVPIRVKKDTEGYTDDIEGSTGNTAIDDL